MNAPATAQETQNWYPSVSPWLIAISVMLATFMEVLDTSIANVAVPYIAGGLAASNEEATWVLTSYLVSNAIVLPVTGWLSEYFGRRRFLIACIFVFIVASALCGLAQSLDFIIFARIIQGAGGGGLQPISQAILLTSFRPKDRGLAMSVFAIGVVVAPVLGPTLGGWITDNYSWRWIFYINIPVGILAMFMTQTFVEDPPYLTKPKEKIDYIGLGLLGLWVSTFQIILSKGQQDNWFQAEWICYFAGISAITFIAFIAWELYTPNPIINLRILKNRNFTVGIVLMTFFGAALYALITLVPLFLQDLMAYTATWAGIASAPRGVGAILFSAILGRITGIIDNRILMILGFGCLAFSTAWLGAITLQISVWSIIWPMFWGGVATVLVFIPLTTSTMAYLSNKEMGNGTGIFNLMRNLGGSIGIAALVTYQERGALRHQDTMLTQLVDSNPVYREHILANETYLAQQPVFGDLPHMAQGMIYDQLLVQSNYWAFVDCFRLLAWLSAIAIPLVFLFKKVSKA